MAIAPVDLAGAAAPVAAPLEAAASGFENAIGNALGLGGGDDKLVEAMVEGGVQLMGQMMMRHAGEMLNEAMADDEG